MKRGAGFGGALALCGVLASCATTGDPQQGGLFGWSETKARERQNERQTRVAGAEADLSREETHARSLEATSAGTDRQLANAAREKEHAENKLRAQQAALLAKVDRLENESPTPATASRARTYRRKVNTVAAQTAWPPADRSLRLRSLEVEIDTMLERVQR